MSHRKLQKEVDAVFKKIHEGLDLFNYYFSRHESSSNDSQREKLESDLKKEIKKLQKFRDQIKTWQLNDAMEATIAPLKLQEHRKLVEEAMECYKDVEKNSKMKSFSNQSIMLAALESGDSDLSQEVLDSIEYLTGVIDEINDQSEALESDYEKLSQKKARKNNALVIEEQKQELDAFMNKNKFHVEKLEACIEFLKTGKIEPSMIDTIQDDLNFYVESNQDPDYIDDDTLYDEIFKEAKQSSERAHKEKLANEADTSIGDILITKKSPVLSSPSPSSNSHSSSTSSVNLSQTTTTVSTKVSPSNSQGSNIVKPSKPLLSTPKVKPAQPVLEPVDFTSPGIIKTLKPAATPQKPVGALKWAAAAAGTTDTAQTNGHGPVVVKPVQQNEIVEQKTQEQTSQEIELAVDDPNYKFVKVMQNSSLAPAELELFSDVNLARLPSGIQDLIVSFTATRKVGASAKSKLLVNSQEYNQFKTPILKPYLPRSIQLSSLNSVFVHGPKPPVQIAKLQSFWNKIRALNQYDKVVDEIQLLISANNPENAPYINELTLVLFYGFYYGYTPLENLIAENCLFILGWKPYGSRTSISTSDALSSPDASHCYWFKSVDANAITSLETESLETGDFQVFDLFVWEIYVKYNFRFDVSLCQLAPSTVIC